LRSIPHVSSRLDGGKSALYKFQETPKQALRPVLKGYHANFVISCPLDEYLTASELNVQDDHPVRCNMESCLSRSWYESLSCRNFHSSPIIHGARLGTRHVTEESIRYANLLFPRLFADLSLCTTFCHPHTLPALRRIFHQVSYSCQYSQHFFMFTHRS
jgi:hypothetical protein